MFLATQPPTPIQQLYCNHCSPYGFKPLPHLPVLCLDALLWEPRISDRWTIDCPQLPMSDIPDSWIATCAQFPKSDTSDHWTISCPQLPSSISGRWIEVSLPVAYMCQNKRSRFNRPQIGFHKYVENWPQGASLRHFGPRFEKGSSATLPSMRVATKICQNANRVNRSR